MSAPIRVGVVGLGAMGLPIGRTLAGKGFPVMGFDRGQARRAGLPGAAGSLTDCVAGSDVLLLSLPSSREVEAVMADVLALGRPGLVVADASTAEPASTRRLQAQAARAGIGYVDAPVSGGPKGAAEGRLLVMAGGEETDLRRAMPVLEAIARQVIPCGGPGTGNVAKLVNNLLCAAHLALAGEALAIGEAAGIEPGVLAGVLAVGSGRSAVTEVNLPAWVLSGAYDSGFTMGLMRKDVRLAADLARAVDRLGPLSAAAAARWEASGAFSDGEDFNRMVDLARRG